MNEPTKQTGILWKLNAEEKESLGRVCSMARVYCRQNNIPAQSKEMQDIRQLLGRKNEQKEIEVRVEA